MINNFLAEKMEREKTTMSGEEKKRKGQRERENNRNEWQVFSHGLNKT